MPTKKKVYAVYFIKKTKHIAILSSSEEYVKNIKQKFDVVYDRGDDLVFHTRNISPEHIKDIFKDFILKRVLEVVIEIDNYKGE